MVHFENGQGASTLREEQELDNIIHSGQRTIEWSLALYFKPLKKGARIFAEKILKDEASFFDTFTSYIFNDCDMAQLIDELQDHLNSEIIGGQQKWLPGITFMNVPLLSGLKDVLLLLDEQKTTINISSQLERALVQLTTRTSAGVTPAWLPRSLTMKAHVALAKAMTRSLAADTGRHRQQAVDLLEKQLAGLLENAERFLADQLKYQLAEQLYRWFEQIEEKQKDSPVCSGFVRAM